MKYKIDFLIEGPGGRIWTPNNTGKIECENLASLLVKLSTNLPSG